MAKGRDNVAAICGWIRYAWSASRLFVLGISYILAVGCVGFLVLEITFCVFLLLPTTELHEAGLSDSYVHLASAESLKKMPKNLGE